MINEENKELELKGNLHNNNEDNQKANNLCILSVVLNFVPFVLIGLFSSIFADTLNRETIISSVIFEIFSLILRVCPVLAFIIMIYVRVKYQKNTFGKVLMIFYIVGIIIGIISFALLLFTCFSEMRKCPR